MVAEPVTPGKVCTTLEISKLLPGLDFISSEVRFWILKGVYKVAARTDFFILPTTTSFNVISRGSNSAVI